MRWHNGDPRFGAGAGLASFTHHGNTLAAYYKESESEQFVRGFASVWGGVPYSDLPVFATASTAVRGRQDKLNQLWEGSRGPNATNGWYGHLVDKVDPSYEQGHHYSFFLYASYQLGADVAMRGAQAIDSPESNSADYILSVIAIGQGSGLRSGDITVSGFAHAMCVALGHPYGGC